MFLPGFNTDTSINGIGPALRLETGAKGSRRGIELAVILLDGSVMHEYGAADAKGWEGKISIYDQKDDWTMWGSFENISAESDNSYIAGPTLQRYEQDSETSTFKAGVIAGRDFPVRWLKMTEIEGFYSKGKDRTDLTVSIPGFPLPPTERNGGWDSEQWGIGLTKHFPIGRGGNTGFFRIGYSQTNEGFPGKEKYDTLTIGGGFSF